MEPALRVRPNAKGSGRIIGLSVEFRASRACCSKRWSVDEENAVSKKSVNEGDARSDGMMKKKERKIRNLI